MLISALMSEHIHVTPAVFSLSGERASLRQSNMTIKHTEMILFSLIAVTAINASERYALCLQEGCTRLRARLGGNLDEFSGVYSLLPEKNKARGMPQRHF